MNILFVSATEFEIEPLVRELRFVGMGGDRLKKYAYRNLNVDVLVTGLGMTATAFYLGKFLNNGYDCSINIGLAGSFSADLEIGAVVNVVQDCFSELGAEDGDLFIPVAEMNLATENQETNLSRIKNTVLENIPKVSGITVNTVHGNETSIDAAFGRFHPNVESMEGAAFLLACRLENIPCTQIRAISNLVEKRNRAAWKIPLAIEALNKKAHEILNAFP